MSREKWQRPFKSIHMILGMPFLVAYLPSCWRSGSCPNELSSGSTTLTPTHSAVLRRCLLGLNWYRSCPNGAMYVLPHTFSPIPLSAPDSSRPRNTYPATKFSNSSTIILTGSGVLFRLELSRNPVHPGNTSCTIGRLILPAARLAVFSPSL